jgi:hypothetical protein
MHVSVIALLGTSNPATAIPVIVANRSRCQTKANQTKLFLCFRFVFSIFPLFLFSSLFEPAISATRHHRQVKVVSISTLSVS